MSSPVNNHAIAMHNTDLEQITLAFVVLSMALVGYLFVYFLKLLWLRRCRIPQDYDEAKYLGNVVSKWVDRTRRAPPSSPLDYTLLNCWAFSEEHPHLAEMEADLDNSIELAYSRLVDFRRAIVADLGYKGKKKKGNPRKAYTTKAHSS